MDPVTAAFILLIALVSGGIAYFADWLGRKLGKKRLRLGSLRPKHTAAVGVVSSGILISMFSIALMFAVSSDVRQWIREGRRAIGELRSAELQRDQAVLENKRIIGQNEKLVEDSAHRQAEIELAGRTLGTLQLKTRALQSQIRTFRDAAQSLQKKFDTVQTQYLASSQQLLSTEAKRIQAEKSLSSIQSQYTALNTQFHGLTSSYAELSRQSKEIQDYNTKITRANMTLTASNNDLEAKGKNLQAKNDEALQSLESLKSEINLQTKELQENRTSIRVAEEYLSRLDNVVQVSYERPMTFAAHQELARYALPAHLSAEAARDAVTSLLREARTAADKAGAKGTGAEGPSAGIFPHLDPRTGSNITTSQIEDNVVRQITGRPTEQVIVATSTLNAFQGQPVSVDIKAYPNPLIYKQGQVLAETKIDSSDSEDDILSRIDSLLTQKVRERARKDNLIPTEGSFGNVTGTEVYKILRTVQTADRTVRLQAIARMNTRAGDPLEIDLRIR